jgi:hypothetical protein
MCTVSPGSDYAAHGEQRHDGGEDTPMRNSSVPLIGDPTGWAPQLPRMVRGSRRRYSGPRRDDGSSPLAHGQRRWAGNGWGTGIRQDLREEKGLYPPALRARSSRS